MDSITSKSVPYQPSPATHQLDVSVQSALINLQHTPCPFDEFSSDKPEVGEFKLLCFKLIQSATPNTEKQIADGLIKIALTLEFVEGKPECAKGIYFQITNSHGKLPYNFEAQTRYELLGKYAAPITRQHAVTNMAKAAELCPVHAYCYGQMLLNGNGVTKDVTQARVFFQQSAEGGFEKAKEALEQLPPAPAVPLSAIHPQPRVKVAAESKPKKLASNPNPVVEKKDKKYYLTEANIGNAEAQRWIIENKVTIKSQNKEHCEALLFKANPKLNDSDFFTVEKCLKDASKRYGFIAFALANFYINNQQFHCFNSPNAVEKVTTYLKLAAIQNVPGAKEKLEQHQQSLKKA